MGVGLLLSIINGDLSMLSPAASFGTSVVAFGSDLERQDYNSAPGLEDVQPSNTSPKEALKYKTIAVVGASKNPKKEAHTVPAYLQRHGYKVIPVNPIEDSILGEKAYPSLLDLPADLAKKVEMIEVFRPSEDLPEVARQTVKMKERYGRPFVFWAQLGLESNEAKQILDRGKIPYVMDRCMKIEHGLMGRKEENQTRTDRPTPNSQRRVRSGGGQEREEIDQMK